MDFRAAEAGTGGRVVSLNAGRCAAVDWASRLDRTAIDKRPLEGPVRVGALGLAGDEQADRSVHGGADRAVYAYAREDLDWWAEQVGRPLRHGQFGENLTTGGVDVTGAVIGERWRVGRNTLEVSSPRIPCRTFQNFMGERGWIRRFLHAGRPGAYLRVVHEGVIAPGDEIEVIHRPAHGVTIRDVYQARAGSEDQARAGSEDQARAGSARALMARLLEAPELPADWRQWALKAATGG